MITVVLADDQALVRAGFSSLLSGHADIRVVGEAENGTEAIALARRLRPSILLADIRMPELDGIEVTRRITADPTLADVRVIVLTTYELDEYVFEALRAGASGFLTKDVEPAALRAAIRAVADGHALLTPSVTRRVVDALAAGPRVVIDAGRLAVLSDREREVLALVGAGLDNGQIGQRLHMSPLTAKTHVSHILRKLNVRDRSQLVIIAFQTGLVRP